FATTAPSLPEIVRQVSVGWVGPGEAVALAPQLGRLYWRKQGEAAAREIWPPPCSNPELCDVPTCTAYVPSIGAVVATSRGRMLVLREPSATPDWYGLDLITDRPIEALSAFDGTLLFGDIAGDVQQRLLPTGENCLAAVAPSTIRRIVPLRDGFAIVAKDLI